MPEMLSNDSYINASSNGIKLINKKCGTSNLEFLSFEDNTKITKSLGFVYGDLIIKFRCNEKESSIRIGVIKLFDYWRILNI